MGQDGQRLGRAGRFLHAGVILLARRFGAPTEHGRLREGPVERSLATLGARGAIALARRGLGRLDSAAVGHARLPAGEALEVMDCIEPPPAQARTKPRDRAQPVQRVGVVRLGCFEDAEFHVAAPMVIVGNQGQVDFDPLLPGRSGKALSDAVAVRLIGDLLAHRGPVIRAVGLLAVGESRRPLAHQLPPPPEEISGRPPRGGRHLGGREHLTTAQDGNLVRVERVVCGLAPRERLPRARVAEPKRHPVARTAIGQPLPGEETVDADDQIGAGGRDGLQKRFWASGHVPVEQTLSTLGEDTEGQAASLSIDAAGELVRLGVESPEVSSSPE
jgi:hypothetical protein